ncbi:MAG: FtsW/RodA/SpoVE family cell cycle protein [Pyrinomonadaceae bacterium]|nr:FtsW/RodA/SpoVE family cell cycle protein [Pyrinomonadaceae bacterium]
MKNRTSVHVLILLLIVVITAISHYSIYYGGLIRGYETSGLSALRNLALLSALAILPIFIKKFLKYDGNWTIYTTAVLLFSMGLTVQYRLFSDPEYTSRKDKAEARQAKIKTLQMHYIQENYSAEKKKVMGLPATPPTPVDLSTEKQRPAEDSYASVFVGGRTYNPVLGFIGLLVFYIIFRRNDMLERIQQKGFLIVLITVPLLLVPAGLAERGKFLGMTPWELAKVPFLLGFAAILAVLYKNLARTYWGIPRAKDVLPLVVMAILPFLPFFVLQDFGQMMVFSSVYATLYLIAVRRLPQRLVLVGSVALVISILVVGALPVKTQEKIPLLPSIAAPVKTVLPSRIQQRFHLWLDGFDPPTPETPWWTAEYDKYYKKFVENNTEMQALIQEDPEGAQEKINIEAWFDILAFQPAQATFGLASGGVTGRGLGLGYPELIPVADSDYIFAALAEELGLFGGLLVTFALIVFVGAGVRTARDARDMFSKLCCVGLAAFIGFQALVNIGGITRALPMTGITLPFVSHGGFSLITSFVMLGMLMAFSHRNAIDRRRDMVEIKPQTI